MINLSENQRKLLAAYDGSKKDIAVYGGVRSGKTFGAIYCVVKYLLDNPKSTSLAIVNGDYYRYLKSLISAISISFDGEPIENDTDCKRINFPRVKSRLLVYNICDYEMAYGYYEIKDILISNAENITNEERKGFVFAKPHRMIVDLTSLDKNHWTYEFANSNPRVDAVEFKIKDRDNEHQ